MAHITAQTEASVLCGIPDANLPMLSRQQICIPGVSGLRIRAHSFQLCIVGKTLDHTQRAIIECCLGMFKAPEHPGVAEWQASVATAAHPGRYERQGPDYPEGSVW